MTETLQGSPSQLAGLTDREAQSRLAADGFNEIPRSDQRTFLRILGEVLREPMLALLVGGGVLYLALGDLKEALILLAFALLSVSITVVQESRTERVLDALRSLSSPRALVIRDGERKRIPGREVVSGDLIVFSEGDRVPADAKIIDCNDLQIDESLLTGESVPVRKTCWRPNLVAPSRPGGDDSPFAYSGSLIVRGSGIGQVVATGVKSEMGRIGLSLRNLAPEVPRLQIQTRRLVRIFAAFGIGVSVLAVLLYGIFRGGWLKALLGGIALGMAMLPEEFPVVLAVFMAMGAWRISRARVLTRRAAAIEALGSATVLCTDKTGTLTENRMSVAELRPRSSSLWQPNQLGGSPIPNEFRRLLEVGILSSEREPADPMEKALHSLGREHLPEHPAFSRRSLERTYGLRPNLLAVSNAWKDMEGKDGYFIATKGAPETVFRLCHITGGELEELLRSVDAMAAEGLRVLGVAHARFEGPSLPNSQLDFAFEFEGLVGFADPLRQTVPEAVRQCRSAGIKVIMITGDYPTTARAIARQAGIDAEGILTGDELESLDDSELTSRLQCTTVFARIRPEQKLRIVAALKAQGEIVAMTGDGVNDAPSLKAAHIGIAMGGRGTDVAREASSIILLDDDFGSIVQAIRLGRRIYDNLRKATGFILAVHVPIAGLALVPLVFGLPIILGPVHIALLELVIDPVCSLVFEAEDAEHDLMRRPPRSPASQLMPRALMGWGMFQGVAALLLVLAILSTALAREMPEDETRALTFVALVLVIVGLIFVNRSFSSSLIAAVARPSAALVSVFPIVGVTLGLTLYWPYLSNLFRFGPLHVDDIGVTVGAGVLLLAVLEVAKSIWRGQFAA